jgi:hypothetical protein
MPTEIVHSLKPEQWLDFVAGNPQSNVFHTAEMFRVFAQTEGHRPLLWATVDGEGNPLALLVPVQITLMGGFLRPFTTRAVAYGSVLCAPGPEGREALATLLRAYSRPAQGRPLFTELRNLSDLSGIQPILQENGFVHEAHLNFLIDLGRPVDEIWSSVHSNVRANVRKARRKGVVVQEVTSLAQVPVVYELLTEAYERIRIPLTHRSLFEAAFKVLHPRRMVKFYTAWVEDTCIGVGVHLLHKKVIYAWYGAATRDYASYKANDLLNWHVLEWGAQNGFDCFDFGGAGKPDEDYGPRQFKAKFGGELVNYGRNTYVHRPRLLRLSEWGYQLYRRFL